MATVWTGTISFGLVSIPVKLQPATRSHDVSFNLLHRDCGNRIKLQYYCPHDEEVVERSDLVKGYQHEKGKYIFIEDSDLEDIEPESSSNLEIVQFVKLEEIDPLYFERSYFLVPANEKNNKSFSLLVAAMQEKKRVALGQLMMREHEYLAAIRPGMGGMMLHLMNYEDEIREIEAVDTDKLNKKQLDLAENLIDNLTEDFEPEKFKNAYIERLQEMLEAKAKGKKVTIYEKKKKPRVADLMEALRKSVQQTQATPRKKPQRRAQKKTA